MLVGVSAAGLQDIRVTPLGEAVPGVKIHAQIISQIMAGQFLNRPAWVDGAEVLAIAALSLLLVTIASFVGPLAGLIAAGVVMALIAAVCCYKGFNSRFGAEGVSTATTQAVVDASVLSTAGCSACSCGWP